MDRTEAQQAIEQQALEQPALEDNKTETRSEGEERLAPLFTPDAAQGFRSRWDEIQIGFVDDPRNAVKRADDLVGQVMNSLSETFANERSALDAQMNRNEDASTENLRVALRHYRSFFQRLLAL
jgi:hypothetical protein